MSELDIACMKLQVALSNRSAQERYRQRDKNITIAWKELKERADKKASRVLIRG